MVTYLYKPPIPYPMTDEENLTWHDIETHPYPCCPHCDIELNRKKSISDGYKEHGGQYTTWCPYCYGVYRIRITMTFAVQPLERIPPEDVVQPKPLQRLTVTMDSGSSDYTTVNDAVGTTLAEEVDEDGDADA